MYNKTNRRCNVSFNTKIKINQQDFQVRTILLTILLTGIQLSTVIQSNGTNAIYLWRSCSLKFLSNASFSFNKQLDFFIFSFFLIISENELLLV